MFLYFCLSMEPKLKKNIGEDKGRIGKISTDCFQLRNDLINSDECFTPS